MRPEQWQRARRLVRRTGTALATLSGPAYVHATLAALGGGSLATGGLGMAGGAAVLGAVVAAPMLAVASFAADRKIRSDYEEARRWQSEVIRYSEEVQEQPAAAGFARAESGYVCLWHLLPGHAQCGAGRGSLR